MASRVVFILPLRECYLRLRSRTLELTWRSTDEAVQLANEMLGNRLITKQTGPTGQLVDRVSNTILNDLLAFSGPQVLTLSRSSSRNGTTSGGRLTLPSCWTVRPAMW